MKKKKSKKKDKQKIASDVALVVQAYNETNATSDNKRVNAHLEKELKKMKKQEPDRFQEWVQTAQSQRSLKKNS